jgi:hypothetical protein
MAARSASGFLRVLAPALAAVLLAGWAAADDREEPDGRDAEERRETARLIRAELPRWKIGTGADGAEFKLHPTPILNWTNPATGRIFGEIYLWTADGRPEAVMSLYKAWEPDWGFAGEFHSLSPAGVVGRREGAVVWNCDEPGIGLRGVPDAPAPAQTDRRRLQQMRAIAADFSTVLIDRRHNPDGERQALRLLTNPVFRYASPAGKVADGAIFAFVVGTDAEVLLLLEASGEESQCNWQYALARLNRDELAAFYKEQEVWRVDRGIYGARDEPYFLMTLPELPPRENESNVTSGGPAKSTTDLK